MFAMWRHLSNNVPVAQVLTLCAPRRPHFLQMTACFHAPYKRLNIVFLCVICPELLHSYHNWILIGSRTHTSDIQVKMAASLSRTSHTSNIVIVAQFTVILIVI